MSVAVNNDVELVGASLAGNRDAFGQIVSRYQSLVCSLAFSATGSLSQSEDLAQETFVTAWKQLAGLREPEKLRAWLCGIARNLINNSLRKQGREPSHRAESLEEISESRSPEPLPAEQAISNEELAILWRSLERIPEIYREPLVLFYREHQSIEAVAQSLELTEDAVKQRLSRGRKLLHEEVLAFVEGALQKTNPGKVFTLGVLAALPMAATSAKAAAVSTVVAKGSAAAKSAATLGSLGGLFAVLGSLYISLRAKADDTKSPRERQFMLQVLGIRFAATLFSVVVCFGIEQLVFFPSPVAHEMLIAAFVFSIYVFATWLFIHSSRRQQQIQIEENTFVEAEWTTPRKHTGSTVDSVGIKSNTHLKSARFMAFVLVMSAGLIFQAPWKQHLDHAILLTAVLVLGLFWSFRRMQNSPRYQSLRSAWNVFTPVVMGLMTLFFFNLHQYQAKTGSDAASIASPTEVFSFNLVVTLAYAAFFGILIWIRQREIKSASPD